MLGLPQVPGVDQTTQGLPSVSTDPSLLPVDTSPSLPPVPVTIPIPRTRTGSMRTNETSPDAPRAKDAGAVPRVAEDGKRRPSRVSRVHAEAISNSTTQEPLRRASRVHTVPPPTAPSDPAVAEPTANLPPVPEKTWTPTRIALAVGALAVVAGVGYLSWFSFVEVPQRARRTLTPIKVDEPVAVARPEKTEALAPIANAKPGLTLDSRSAVIDPFAMHLEDIALDPAHKYRMLLRFDDSRTGIALARLDEKNGWGVMRRMASHAALQFGGAKALRLHCEPGTSFAEGQTFPLELQDLANKQTTKLALDPAKHCWDFEVMRTLDLGEGVRKRVRVPTDSKVKLGEQTPLKIAYVIEALGEKKQWKAGVLNPGESVLAEGRVARFALIDPYASDNEGTVTLQLLDGDTQSSGLVTPSVDTGAQFVPINR